MPGGMDNAIRVPRDGKLELVVVLGCFTLCIGWVFTSVGALSKGGSNRRW